MESSQTPPAIAVFGKSGAGKSTICNWLCGTQDQFVVGTELKSQTSFYKAGKGRFSGNQNIPIIAVDFPGYLDSETDDNQGLRDSEIFLQFIFFLHKNPEIKLHCILICVLIGSKLQKDDIKFLKLMLNFLEKEEALKRTFFVLTQINTLKPPTKDKWITNTQEKAIKVVEELEIPKISKEFLSEFARKNFLLLGKKEDFLANQNETLQRINSLITGEGIIIQAHGKYVSQIAKKESKMKGILEIMLKEFGDEEKRLKQDPQKREHVTIKKNLLKTILEDSSDKIEKILKYFHSSDPFLSAVYYYFTSKDLNQGMTFVNDVYHILNNFNASDEESRWLLGTFKEDMIDTLYDNLGNKVVETLNKLFTQEQSNRAGWFKEIKLYKIPVKKFHWSSIFGTWTRKGQVEEMAIGVQERFYAEGIQDKDSFLVDVLQQCCLVHLFLNPVGKKEN